MRSGTVPAGNVDASRPSPFVRRVIDFLAGLHGKRRYLFLAALALLFTFPSLWVGFAQDDFIFLSILKGSPGLEGLEEHFLNTFSFSEGDLDKNRIRMERGIMPWWSPAVRTYFNSLASWALVKTVRS